MSEPDTRLQEAEERVSRLEWGVAMRREAQTKIATLLIDYQRILWGRSHAGASIFAGSAHLDRELKEAEAALAKARSSLAWLQRQ